MTKKSAKRIELKTAGERDAVDIVQKMVQKRMGSPTAEYTV